MTNMGKSVGLILAGIAVLFVGRAQSQNLDPVPTNDLPLWQIDIRKYGYNASSVTNRFSVIDFTDSGHLAVAWLTLDDPTVGRKIGLLTPTPAHLHVIVLDSMTGQIESQHTWSTPSSPARFLGIPDGNFLICTGGMLRLFSPTFNVIQAQNISSDSSCSKGFFASLDGVSPSRRSLLLSDHSSRLSQQNDLIDTGSFARLNAWTENVLVRSISDHWLMAYCGQQREMCIREADKSWQPLQLTSMPTKNVGALFVSDETMLIEARNKMAVVAVDSTELFQMELPKNRSFGEARSSTDGDRFAVMENRLRGIRNEFLDMYPFDSNDRAVVFSIANRRAIYAVKVNGISPWRPLLDQNDPFALSPDGTLLAVRFNGILTIYRLPGRSP